MTRRVAVGVALGVAITGLFLSNACNVQFEQEDTGNLPPTTFFESAPGDTSFTNEVFFAWLGTDEDSDVVAYQYQLVLTDSLWYYTAGLQGNVVESLDPRNEDGAEEWSPRTTDEIEIFPDLEDGWYEFRVRAIDSGGQPDSTPALQRFYVFFDDISPLVTVTDPVDNYDLGGQTSITFTFTASDESRSSLTPQTALQYSYRLRADPGTAESHQADPWEPWTFFRQDPDTVTVGAAAPTFYNDLEAAGGKWRFSVRVRDPAGNSGLGEVVVQRK